LKDAIAAQSGGRSPIADVTYGTTYFVKLIAVDLAGNASAASTQSSGTPSRVSGIDIENLAIATTHLGDGAVTALKIADATITSAKIGTAQILNANIANAAIDDAKIANVAVGKLTAGTLAADITVSARIKTANTGARTEMNTNGFEAYNSSNVRTFYVNASTGDVSITGDFQTASSGQRIVIDTSGTIYYYPTTGSDYAFINAPSASSIGINSGTGGGSTRTRFWANTSYAEMIYMTTAQVQAGGRVTVDSTGAYMSGLSGDTAQISTPSGRCTIDNSGSVLTHSGTTTVSGSPLSLYAANTITIDASTVDVGSGINDTVRSTGIYNSVTTGTANIVITTGGSTGELWRLSSSKRYKVEITDVPKFDVYDVLKIRPVTYLDKGEWERNDKSSKNLRRHFGVIAEEVGELRVIGEWLTEKNNEGEYESANYDRIGVLLIPAINAILGRVRRIENQLLNW
jgi:hypothetical protein